MIKDFNLKNIENIYEPFKPSLTSTQWPNYDTTVLNHFRAWILGKNRGFGRFLTFVGKTTHLALLKLLHFYLNFLKGRFWAYSQLYTTSGSNFSPQIPCILVFVTFWPRIPGSNEVRGAQNFLEGHFMQKCIPSSLT